MRADGFCVMKDEAEKNEWILDQLVIVKTKKLYGERHGNGAGRKKNSLQNHITGWNALKGLWSSQKHRDAFVKMGYSIKLVCLKYNNHENHIYYLLYD